MYELIFEMNRYYLDERKMRLCVMVNRVARFLSK